MTITAILIVLGFLASLAIAIVRAKQRPRPKGLYYKRTAQPEQGSSSFYKVMAIVFFVLGGVFIWAAVNQHSWSYGAFAAITVVNGLVSIVKSQAAGVARQ